MRKTSVYLTADEAESLRRLSVREGRSQAELIREGIRRVIKEVDATPRTFRSMGAGRGGKSAGSPGKPPRWPSDKLYRKAMGEE